jgi:FAD/FMN-containing dehydrogenase/Fe-S oxidoreductase
MPHSPARDSFLGQPAEALERDLRRHVRGEVRFDAGSRALYATDGSNYRQVPIGVVRPLDANDVIAAVAVSREHGAPLLPRGAGTSLAGQCCNVAVVLDMSRHMHAIVDIDPERRRARVQPGVVLDRLREAAERHRLTFGPDPATHSHCTLGGMIGNNSCGVHSIMSGKTEANIERLDILTCDGVRMTVGPTTDQQLSAIIAAGGRHGKIYAELLALRDRYADLIRQRFPVLPRRVSGYNLDQLLPENGFNVARALVGTEGTCVTVLEATTRLIHSPPARSLLVLGYPDLYMAADDVMRLMAHAPIGLEGMDARLVGQMKRKGQHAAHIALLPEGNGWLLVEFGGDTAQEANDRARRLMADLAGQPGAPSMRLLDDPVQAKAAWTIRESALGATAFVPGEGIGWEGWEDAAVPPENLGRYLREVRDLLKKYGYVWSMYGHFGDGCVHMRIDFDLLTESGLRRFRGFVDEAADLVVRYGGSLSGEHGDGQARAELLPKMFGPELVEAFREFKTIWDPDGRMNPGKVVDPYGILENLRLGTSYDPARPKTHFSFPTDPDGFAYSTLRCVGVGKCRKTESGTMCPSYMVTREEQHSTRGRAHLLFEMLRGEVVRGGWRDEQVKDALDLCLACKACKTECPANVDMATYKAEFLSHYYEGRRRPLAAYAMGLVDRWSRLAAVAPRLANATARAPLVGRLLKAAVGIASERSLPVFAPETFTAWFRRRPRVERGNRRRVILWPDTFNNHFHPETARAAVEVLEHAGCAVDIPPQGLCCGRPLYDFGMLGLAKRRLAHILGVLESDIAAGTPIVGLEPSCAAVFRDELINLFPDDPRAARLREQVFLLGEFLTRQTPGYQPPRLARRALLHGHCHQKALVGMEADAQLLTSAGVEVVMPDAGCCGMAGAFGFDRRHYDVSVAAGERVLLPAVRSAPADAFVIADGFSCREQIAQLTPRRALHLAEVLQIGLREGPARR